LGLKGKGRDGMGWVKDGVGWVRRDCEGGGWMGGTRVSLLERFKEYVF